MVPGTGFGVLIFMLFVIPGTCYELLQARTQYSRDESAFIQISRIVSVGTLLTATALVMLWFVSRIEPSALLDVPALVERGATYIAANTGLVARSLLAHLTIAVLLAVFLSDLLASSRTRRVFEMDAWHFVADVEGKRGLDVGLSVRLKDGAEILGMYYGASMEFDPAKRELLLRKPFYVVPAGSREVLAFEDAWERMVISGSDVAYVTTVYVGPREQEQDTGSWHRRAEWLRRNCLSWPAAAAGIFISLAVLMVTAC